MSISRPIPGWIPSTPEVRGDAALDLVQRHAAVAIHFWAPWNGADPLLDRSLQALAERFKDRVVFYSCNVDLAENREFCQQCGLANVPTLAIWVSGRLRRMLVGFREPEPFAVEIESQLAPPRKAWWSFWGR